MLTFSSAKGGKVNVMMDRRTAFEHMMQVHECLDRLLQNDRRQGEISELSRELNKV